MKKHLLLLAACVANLFTEAQHSNFWYFGDYAAIDFSSGTPVALNNSAMATQEGCASISDVSGDLLFYTDGVTVYDRNHMAMPNGNGLLGGSSSSQSALIIPAPGNFTNSYYIFTVPQYQSPDGFNYSLVDISLNGGNGDLVSKNILLDSSALSEKLAATYHENGSDVWVTNHLLNSDSFCSYLITTSGISAPVISSVGSTHSGGMSEMGYMKFSPSGNKIALARVDLNQVEIFDFDNSTGIISNPITFNPTSSNYPYGIEFSPDGSKLYIHTDINPAIIFQLDMNAGSPSAILGSAQIVFTSTANGGAMQTGPDGKIYFVRYQTNWLGVINNPNAAGIACDAVLNGVSLGSSSTACQLGLPNFLSNYFNKITGVDERESATTINVYPNPVNDKLNIVLGNTEKAKIILYDCAARKIIEQEFEKSVTINTEELAKGVYIYKLISGKEILKKGKIVR